MNKLRIMWSSALEHRKRCFCADGLEHRRMFNSWSDRRLGKTLDGVKGNSLQEGPR